MALSGHERFACPNNARRHSGTALLGLGLLSRARVLSQRPDGGGASDYSMGRASVVRRFTPTRSLHQMRRPGRDAARTELGRVASRLVSVSGRANVDVIVYNKQVAEIKRIFPSRALTAGGGSAIL